MTPSGKPPKSLITPTIKPMPKAYSQVPDRVIGEVTISVAIKKAPMMRPPANR